MIRKEIKSDNTFGGNYPDDIKYNVLPTRFIELTEEQRNYIDSHFDILKYDESQDGIFNGNPKGVINISDNPEFIEQQLTQAKVNKLAEVNLKAYEYENNGLISYEGIDPNGNTITVQVETTDKNIGKINGLINMFNAEKITQYIWSAKDDTQIVLKKEDAYNLSELFAEFSSKIWIEKQPYFKNLAEVATTIEELNSIVVDFSLDLPTATA